MNNYSQNKLVSTADEFAWAEGPKNNSSGPRVKYDPDHLWYDKGKEKFIMKLPDGSWLSAKKDLTKINWGTHYGLSDNAEKDEKGTSLMRTRRSITRSVVR